MSHVMIRTIIVGLAVVAGLAGSAVGEAAFFVALDGNDVWSGTLAAANEGRNDGPFATLERARDAVRALKTAGALPAGGVMVLVRGGTYALGQPWVLSSEDSGTAESPVVYAAYPDEEVRLTGGKPVTDFAPVTDPVILERLDESARGHVVQADLKALGIADFGSPEGGGLELFFQDQAMTVSRWPNEGFVKIAEEAGGDKFDVRGRKGDRIGRWVYEEDRPSRWTAETDAWVHGYWFWDWSDQRQKVKSIDTEKKTIEVEQPYHTYGYRKGQWYYAFNLLCEIDLPGEWYLDRAAGVLYFWPPAPLERGTAVVSVLPTLATLSDVSYVTLRGMIFEASRGTAINVSGGAQNRIAACTLRNIGGRAVSISGGTGHGVVGCDVYGLGGGGIGLNGGDRATLTPAGLFAENNHIHHYGRWYRMYQTAVSMDGVGNRISHNLIHDAPHMAINFGGNDHVIEFNEIFNVCQESNDAGAIYAGRDWTMRGTVVRNNYLHDITGFLGHGCVGVYLDDMYCGTTIVGNLFYRVTRAAFIGGGRDNVVENNLFVDCTPALHVDNRAQNWAAYHVETTMKERLDAVPYQQEPWRTRYPELLTLWEDEPAAPKGNRVVHNVCVGGKWDGAYAATKAYVTIADNLVDEDPHFLTPDRIAADRSPSAVDFALAPDSPAFALGFTALPLAAMGLQGHEDRARWPEGDGNGAEKAP